MYRYRLVKLNKDMDGHYTKLCKTMNRQSEIYAEMVSHYKILGKAKMCSGLDAIRKMFDKLNSSYVHVNSTFGAIFGALSTQFYYEFEAISNRMNDIMETKNHLIETEAKLIEKKKQLIKEKQIQKWDLEPDCKLSIDLLLKDSELAMREILPKETKGTYRVRKISGLLHNRVGSDFDRLCKMFEDKVSLNILFMARMCRDMAKEVYNMWITMSKKYEKYSILM